MTKTLVLLRHAHRDKPNGSAFDNGLSDKGWSQAKAIVGLYERLYKEKKPHLLSSPKKRCQETLEPLAKELGVKVAVNELLGEGEALTRRMKEFYGWWKDKAPNFVIACSHGDWIPEFIHHTTGATVACAKGSWCELEWEEGTVRIVTMIQDAREIE